MISIHDDIINYDLLSILNEYAESVPYAISSSPQRSPYAKSNPMLQHSTDHYSNVMHSIVDGTMNKCNALQNYEFSSATIDANRPGQVSHMRTHHGDRLIVVVFANLEWHPDWQGDLRLFSADATNLVQVVQAKPGRVVVFSGDTPYSFYNPTTAAPELQLNYTISMKI